jgi:hypothetical protein
MRAQPLDSRRDGPPPQYIRVFQPLVGFPLQHVVFRLRAAETKGFLFEGVAFGQQFAARQ